MNVRGRAGERHGATEDERAGLELNGWMDGGAGDEESINVLDARGKER
jgi:hypothetical protein